MSVDREQVRQRLIKSAPQIGKYRLIIRVDKTPDAKQRALEFVNDYEDVAITGTKLDGDSVLVKLGTDNFEVIRDYKFKPVIEGADYKIPIVDFR